MIGVAGALIAGAIYLAQANKDADESTEAIGAHMGELVVMMTEHEEKFGKINDAKLRAASQAWLLKNNPKVYERMMRE
jgi:hypothetical protein